MDFSGITTLQGQNIDPFTTAYRNALETQREAELAQLDQERLNQQAAIMSGANTMGMMYSNFPARTKLQYDTNTYYPAIQKVQSSYQQGLDTIRNNMVDYVNSIKSYNEKIADLNEA